MGIALQMQPESYSKDRQVADTKWEEQITSVQKTWCKLEPRGIFGSG